MSAPQPPQPLRPPWPYFGGKRAIAPLIWDALGDVGVYVEPFLGSAAVLLARPHAPRVETVNDKGCFIANFWRALQHDPEGVAHWADNPVNECDLHARHRWLVAQEGFLTRMREDPLYYDVQIAGWWAWGQSLWIGHGWCQVGASRPRQRPAVQGAHPSNGLHRKRPIVAGDRQGNGVQQWQPSGLGDGLTALAARLRSVRVCCGDWSRVCTPVVLTGAGSTGVYFDPPYAHQERDTRLYAVDDDVAQDVAAWCRAHGDNPRYRIVLSGYAGEHDLPGWRVHRYTGNGGYGNQGAGRGRANKTRECLWLSPHCTLPQLELFGEEDTP